MRSDSPPVLRLLHLEDNDVDAELISIQLKSAWPSCEVVHVDTREGFEEALQQNHFDVILSDFTLSGFDGLSALKFARNVRPEIPFIFLSGTIGEERAVEALKHGGTDYVLKDRPARLVPSIQRALSDEAMRRSHQAAELAIREAAARFNHLADVSDDVFLFADLHPLKITYVSPICVKRWGIKPEVIYEEPDAWLKSVHADDRVRVESNYREWIAQKRLNFNEEYRVVLPNTSLCWVHHTGAFGRDATGRNVRMSWVARDVTVAKEAAEQSLRAQRLESIGLLAGGIAHDLNNALFPVLMSVELLRSEVPDASHALLEQIEVSASRGAAMVRQLLSFARGAGVQRVLVDPSRTLEEVEQLVNGTFPKSVSLVIRSAERVDRIEIDPTQLYQVLVNLCVNARDAMPSGGTLTLAVENCRIDESYASFRPNVKPGDYVVFKVTDTGTGIPQELLEKVFDPFFTTKPTGTGTGLGLTTVAGIAHNNGGFVRIYSEVGKGSCFKVFFPAAAATTPIPFATRGVTAELRGNRELILLVDDEESVRQLLKGVLESHNFQVMTAADGTEALAIYATQRDQIKLVITDERMPYMDGSALVRALRHMSPELRIIAMSGLPSEKRLKEFAAQGVTRFLHKPFATDRLLTSVREALMLDTNQAELPFKG
jgi:two-component system cell cycle sensor histidine kinase/response regulator CckA